MGVRHFVAAAAGLLTLLPSARADRAEGPPATAVAEGVPPIPPDLDDGLNQYRATDSAVYEGWLPGRREILCLRWAGEGTSQVFRDTEQTFHQLTHHPQPVAWAYPNPIRDVFLFAADRDGDERNQLYLFDLASGSVTGITANGWHNGSAVWSKSGRSLAFSSDAWDGRNSDVYVASPPARSSLRRLTSGAGVWYATSWSWDDRRLAVVEVLPARDGSRIHVIDVTTGRDEVLPTRAGPPGRPTMTWGVVWSRDGKSLYWVTDAGSDFDRLARYDLATGEEVTLTSHIPWDVDEYDLSDDGSTIILIANEDGRSRLHVLDARTGFERPGPPLGEGRISNLDFRRGTREFAFRWGTVRMPQGIYSYDLDSGRRTVWVQPLPGSDKGGLASDPQLIRYPTFDGRSIPAFVRRAGADFRGRRPVLIEFHGGPASQALPSFSSFEDYLTHELGIVVIRPNVRGSTGYGRSFEELDDGLRRADAVRDIGALLDWIASQPDLDDRRVAVSGASYGGFMALAALAFYGDRLCAGIDAVGISSFETFLKNADPALLDHLRKEYGDHRDPKMLAFLREISPLSHAGEIRRPLLVLHGSHDPRVEVEESEQIVAAVRRNGLPVWFIRFQNEGHVSKNTDNYSYEEHVRILFLKRYLLGRSS